MPADRAAPIPPGATDRPGTRLRVPRGLIAEAIAAAGLVWGLCAVSSGGSLRPAIVQSGICLGLFVLTVG